MDDTARTDPSRVGPSLPGPYGWCAILGGGVVYLWTLDRNLFPRHPSPGDVDPTFAAFALVFYGCAYLALVRGVFGPLRRSLRVRRTPSDATLAATGLVLMSVFAVLVVTDREATARNVQELRMECRSLVADVETGDPVAATLLLRLLDHPACERIVRDHQEGKGGEPLADQTPFDVQDGGRTTMPGEGHD